MKLGFIGLGKMGSRMVEKLLADGHEVVVWNRSETPIQEFQFKIQNSKVKIASKNLKIATSIEELVQSLEKPRIVWSMVIAGEPTETVLEEVSKYVETDDIVIDGGNAYYKDTQLRYEELRTKNIRFLGIGVSGGIHALQNGFPLMIGGDIRGYEYIKPVLDSLSKPNGGYEYFGQGGAGHFVKMVHNGIEYGMMQAIGEGFGVLQKSQYNLDLLKIAKIYKKGTIVSGFLMDRTVDGLAKDAILSSIEGIIPESGEAKWTVETAKEQGVPIENIEQSLEFRRKSQTDSKVQNSTAAKMVATLRHEFGGHDVKKK